MVKDKTSDLIPYQAGTVASVAKGFRLYCLMIVTVGLLNLIAALRTLDLVRSGGYVAVSYPVWLHVVFSMGWAAAFLWSGWRLWRRRNGSSRWVLLTVGAYGFYLVVWWRVFARSDYAIMRWPFAVLMVVCFIGLAILVGRRFRI